MKKKKTIIISIGGSLIVPDAIDTEFLSSLRALLIRHMKKGTRFVLIAGGGKTCRRYQAAAAEVVHVSKNDLDWIGIHTTRLNAHLLRTIFYPWAHAEVIKDPHRRANFREPMLVTCGWKPGCSTDFDAVLFAKNHHGKILVNLSNIDYVYTKDPRKHQDASPIERIGWKEFRVMLPKKWDPGLNAPFDPIAAREAQKLSMTVAIMNGKNIKNLSNFLEEKPFTGTIIE
ncbi:UMP kinase [Candidatus Uhrbacteria bacterium]|nr:UMP kinase [Candidatus Uhrbacteria bacterium]